MTIQKLVAGANENDPLASTGAQVATAVNGLIDGRAQQAQTVILFGDSFSNSQKSTTPATFNGALQISCWRFLLGRLGNSVNVVRYSGISGNTAQMMLARIDVDVLATESDWVFMQCGANDFWGFSYTAEKVFGEMVQMLTKLTNDGRKVLLLGSPPQTSLRANFDPSKNLQAQLYNQMIAKYCATISNVIFVDIYSGMVDWEDTTNSGGVARFFGNDGIHLSNYGAISVADACMVKLAPHIAPDLSSAVYPQTGGILGTKAVLAGTGGTASSSVTGTVASGWSCSRSSGSAGAGVASKSNGVQRLVATLTASNAPAIFRLSCAGSTNFIPNLTPFVGQAVKGRCKLRLFSTGGVSLRKLEAKLTFVDTVNGLKQVANGTVSSGFPANSDAPFDSGLMILDIAEQVVPEMTTSSSNGAFIEIDCDSIGGGSFTLEVYTFEIYTV